tara:strand:+ start:212 stop:835 length:624 start_codon:yes stop_codon:yes gene_type:complete
MSDDDLSLMQVVREAEKILLQEENAVARAREVKVRADKESNKENEDPYPKVKTSSVYNTCKKMFIRLLTNKRIRHNTGNMSVVPTLETSDVYKEMRDEMRLIMQSNVKKERDKYIRMIEGFRILYKEIQHTRSIGQELNALNSAFNKIDMIYRDLYDFITLNDPLSKETQDHILLKMREGGNDVIMACKVCKEASSTIRKDFLEQKL